MAITFKNICCDFFDFWEKANGKGTDEQIKLWKNIYENKNREVFDLYYSRWGNPNNLKSALNKFPEIIQKINFVNTDRKFYNLYFSGMKNDIGLPVRFGYFIAYIILKELIKKHSISEMARWTSKKALYNVETVLKDIK